MNPFSKEELQGAYTEMISDIAQQHVNTEKLIVVGIANGGIGLGERVAKDLGKKLDRHIGFGILNAEFHRDDLGWKPIPKDFMRTDIPEDIDDAYVILVDDVFHSGRTVRAAINELFDQGRPKKVELAVYALREGRELPLNADYSCIDISVESGKKVKVAISERSATEDQIIIQ